jgi:LemA protein
MNKSVITLGVIGVLLLLLVMNGCNSYNKMVDLNEKVTESWQQVENQYQRRMDLIPNLVSTVQGYADFEKSTLREVIDARSNAFGVKVDPNNLDPESLQKFAQAQNNLSGALGRLMVLVERYPDLKANQGFSDLRVQLEGTENRIATARQDFNTNVKDLNVLVQRFPSKIWAGIFGFEKRAYFESKDGAENAPEVKFDFK